MGEGVLDEVCDLTRVEKAEILRAEEDIGRLSPAELLGVPCNVDRGALKKAYFAKSKQFHPDRFFGRFLGSYEARLNRVFRALKMAYETLRKEKKTGEIKAQTAFSPSLAQKSAQGTPTQKASEASNPARVAELEARRAEIDRRVRSRWGDRLRQRSGVHPQSKERALDHYTRGLDAIRRGAFQEALRAMQLVLTFDPGHPQAARHVVDLRRRMGGGPS